MDKPCNQRFPFEPGIPAHLLDNFPGGFVVLRVNGSRVIPTYFSDNWCKMMGNTRENLMRVYAEDAMSGVHPDDLERVKAAVTAAIASRTQLNINYRINNGNDEYRWVNNRGSFVDAPDGGLDNYAVYIDITAEMQAKEKEHEAQNKLFTVMEHANIMFWEYDMHTDVCTNGFKSIRDLGMPERMENYPECVIESGFVHPDSAEEFRRVHNELKKGVPFIEFSMKTVDSEGKVAWKKVKYTTFFDAVGNPLYALGTSEDVTEQKFAEDRYRQSEALRQKLYRAAMGSFALNLTKNLCLEGHNSPEGDAFYSRFTTADQILAHGAARSVDEKAAGLFRETFGREALLDTFSKGQTAVSLEHVFVTFRNQQVWAKTTVEMIQNPETSDIEAVIYAVDISGQKEKEVLINGVVGAEFDFITQLSAITGHYSMYTQNNEHLILPVLTGYDYYEKNVEFIRQYVAEDQIEQCIEESRVENMVRRLDSEGDYFTYYLSRNPDGTVGHKRLHIFYSDESTKTICLVRTDITRDYQEQEKKNDALREALALAEHANQAKSSFLSKMSHDIRTPMNAIVGMTELAQQDIDDRERVMESLSVIATSSQHLLTIINDILDMSLIESGNMALSSEHFDLPTELQSVGEIAGVLFDAKGQRFELTQQLSHTQYTGDITHLKRVLLNLLNNAAKYTAEGGRIGLNVEEQASANPRISLMRFSVTDSGRGIPADKLDSIFEPFARIDETAPSEGTGLGLAIVKGIVEARGGTIRVESTPGVGSTFTVTMPLEISEERAVQTSGAASPDVPQTADLSGMRILLVEDHPVNAKVAQRMLENAARQWTRRRTALWGVRCSPPALRGSTI